MTRQFSAAIAMTILPAMASAQSPAEALLEHLENKYYNTFRASYEIVEESARCDVSREIPIRVSVASENIQILENGLQCTITQRSGGETTEIRVPCPDSPAPTLIGDRLRQLNDIALSGVAEICVSLWSYAVHLDDVTVATPWSEPAPFAEVHPMELVRFGRRSEMGPGEEHEGSPALVVLVDCIELHREAESDAPRYAGFSAAFALEEVEALECPDGRCPAATGRPPGSRKGRNDTQGYDSSLCAETGGPIVWPILTRIDEVRP